jgi:4-hydroxyphenylacetate 3-monooxygenase
MFYAGARFVTTGHSFRTYDWDAATGMVERFLATYDLAGELAQLHPPGGKAARPT